MKLSEEFVREMLSEAMRTALQIEPTKQLLEDLIEAEPLLSRREAAYVCMIKQIGSAWSIAVNEFHVDQDAANVLGENMVRVLNCQCEVAELAAKTKGDVDV